MRSRTIIMLCRRVSLIVSSRVSRPIIGFVLFVPSSFFDPLILLTVEILRQKDIEIIFSLDLISDASREKGLDEATASMRIKCKSFLHALGVFDKKALALRS